MYNILLSTFLFSFSDFQVLFVDYGNVAMLSEERCAKLPKGLENLPAVAFPCCLDKIKPLQGSRWGTEATQVLDTLTQQKGSRAFQESSCTDSSILIWKNKMLLAIMIAH